MNDENILNRTFNDSNGDMQKKSLKLRDYSSERKELKLNKIAYKTNGSFNGSHDCMQQFKDNLDQSFEAFETSFTTKKPVLKKSISQDHLNNMSDSKKENNYTNYKRDFNKSNQATLDRRNMSYSNQNYKNNNNLNKSNNKETSSHQLFEPRHNYQSESCNREDEYLDNQIHNIKSSIKNPNLKQIEHASMLRKYATDTSTSHDIKNKKSKSILIESHSTTGKSLSTCSVGKHSNSLDNTNLNTCNNSKKLSQESEHNNHYQDNKEIQENKFNYDQSNLIGVHDASYLNRM